YHVCGRKQCYHSLLVCFGEAVPSAVSDEMGVRSESLRFVSSCFLLNLQATFIETEQCFITDYVSWLQVGVIREGFFNPPLEWTSFTGPAGYSPNAFHFTVDPALRSGVYSVTCVHLIIWEAFLMLLIIF